MKAEVQKYKQKIEEKFQNYQRGAVYPFLRKLANGPSDIKGKKFRIPSHSSLTPNQCAEDIACYFAAISQEVEPINPSRFPPRLANFLSCEQKEEIPFISEYDVYLKIQKSKKPNFFVKGDIH